MRTTGSTMSRFDKQRAVKSLGMPHSRRDNAVRGNPPTPTKTQTDRLVGLLLVVFFLVFGAPFFHGG